MASIVILVIMAGLATYQFFKGSFVKSFVTFMAALCAAIVAFAWFEQLGAQLIERDLLTTWAQAISFIVLFVLAFAILQTLAMTLVKEPIDLGVMPERAGRITFGLLTGIIVSGCLLTAAVLAPLSKNFPYQRFDPAKADIQKPHRALFNPDGFISRWFGLISSGSLNGNKSFAVLHAGFMDQVFLNRLAAAKKISVLTESGSISIPDKTAAWPAPSGLKDNSGAPIGSRPDNELIMVRIGFTSRMLTSGGSFTPGQLCLICKQKNDKQRLEGSAINAYPIGYLKAASQIQIKGLADQITLSGQDMTDGTRWIDFAFYIPTGFQPVAVAFKANTLAEIPPMVTTEEAPKPVPFTQSSSCATGYARVATAGTAKIHGIELAARPRLLEGTKLKVADQSQWTNMQTQRSIAPARFDQDAITCVQAELVEPNQADQPTGENKLQQMLRPTSGYSVLSLKCNNPAARSTVRGEQLPTLIDSSGVTHRPCGLIAAGKIADKTIFEADFCPANITFNNDGSVAKPFPENIWLAEQAESISEFYVLYMVRPGTIILSVQPAGAQTTAIFDGTECFLVN